MTQPSELSCTCGKVQLAVTGAPILSAECHCTSCRTAGARLQLLPAATPVLEPNGGTRFVLYRKDRVRFCRGSELLEEHRLSPRAKTRRVVAACCSTPIFLELDGGHWLSMYSQLWPENVRPAIEMRTMTSDLADASLLSDDVPNARRQSLSFLAKLLGAWIAMGFKTPKVAVGRSAI